MRSLFAIEVAQFWIKHQIDVGAVASQRREGLARCPHRRPVEVRTLRGILEAKGQLLCAGGCHRHRPVLA